MREIFLRGGQLSEESLTYEAVGKATAGPREPVWAHVRPEPTVSATALFGIAAGTSGETRGALRDARGEQDPKCTRPRPLSELRTFVAFLVSPTSRSAAST